MKNKQRKTKRLLTGVAVMTIMFLMATACQEPEELYYPGDIQDEGEIAGEDEIVSDEPDEPEGVDRSDETEEPDDSDGDENTGDEIDDENGEPEEEDTDFIDESVELYEIIIAEIENGRIDIHPSGKAKAGAELTVTLTADDPANYRYSSGSMQVLHNGSSVETVTEDNLQWKFKMPDGDVAVSAEFEFIPYYEIKTAVTSQYGNFTMTGTESSGEYKDKARGGASITINVMPNSGYKLADGEPVIMPQGAVSLVRLAGKLAWTFEMAEEELEINFDFVPLDTLEIFKGGARMGITVTELEDDKRYYEQSIDLEAEESGHDGNQRVIKISAALNASGNGIQQSFGLFSDAEIDLDNVTALSFWAKANKQLNIRFVGFGDTDPDKRVVYTGEGFNQQIPVTAEWKRYVVPVPSPCSGIKTKRVFIFNALISAGNHVYIDDIEFVKSGVSLTDITIPYNNEGFYCGAIPAVSLLKGAPLKITYTCSDGTIATLQNKENNHTLKNNLSAWLAPFLQITGDAVFDEAYSINGVIYPKYKFIKNHLELSVNINGITSNRMTASVIDGILLDDFEGFGNTGNVTIPGISLAADSGYLWHTGASGSLVTVRDDFTDGYEIIHSGIGAGSWRPAANANNPQGGRNFEAKDADGYNTLVFRIKVTTGTGNAVTVYKNIDFTFKLKNGGAIGNKTSGDFFAQQFTFDSDGWQEVKINISDYIDAGLDITAVTGYAFGVIGKHAAALRIMLDDIAIVYE